MASPSPPEDLSVLSAISTPSSYATAAQTPGPPLDDNGPPYDFSETRPLPRELERQCQIFIEEQLYINALHMYNQMLVSGQARKDGLKKPTIVAPPAQLGLFLTLTVHPHRTTRLKEKEEIDIVSAAWTYLRNLLDIAGPLNANFKSAFEHVERRTRHRPHASSDTPVIEDRIHSKYADDDSLFHCAPDFWAVVGWAFNCSVLYPERWRFWKLWLDYMITALEVDWAQRQYLDAKGAADATGDQPTTHRQESLLMTYIASAGSGRHRTNHILKALFANGGQVSRRLFREVFKNETKERTEQDQTARLGTVNLDKDDYGGYMNFTDSDPDDAETHTPRATPKTPRSPRTLLTSDVPLGMADAVPLRLRLLDIVSVASETLPSHTLGLDKLPHELSHHMRDEPLNIFQLYLVSMRRQVEAGSSPRSVAAALLSSLLDDLLPPAYEDPARHGADFSAEVLTRCYLPWPAATDDMDDNARVALLHEAALLLVDPDDVATAPGLRDAAVRGIEARKAKTEKSPGRKRRGRPAAAAAEQPGRREMYLRETMQMSGERVLAYIDCLQGNTMEEEEHDEDDGTLYCSCREPASGSMIACENGECKSGGWFHYKCVGIGSPPRGKWWCDGCRGKVA